MHLYETFHCKDALIAIYYASNKNLVRTKMKFIDSEAG